MRSALIKMVPALMITLVAAGCVKEEKPITVDGQTFGYHVTKTESYDPGEVWERLETYDGPGLVDPSEIMRVDTFKLNAKKRARVKEAVADLAEIKTTQRYGIKKEGVE